MPARGGDGHCALTFGYDRSLILSRQRLLEKTGCRSLVALSMQEFVTALESNPVDLVVLCQTVSSEECESIVQRLEQQAPGAQMLIMFNRHDVCRPEGSGVTYLLQDSMSGPSHFVQTAERMLAASLPRIAGYQGMDAIPG